MTRTLAISDTGLRLIKAFEGFRPDDRTLVTGVRIVGYGHRLDADDAPVHMSRADAEQQLLADLEPIETVVNDEVHTPLSQGQFDALCSLALNIGIETFRKSDIVRALNNGRVLDAANGFDVWRKATVNGKSYVVDALMRRRTAEKSLFLRHEPAVPAPSAMLQPQADSTAPFGPTDDGLPRITADDSNGIVERANIINAERADAADAPATFLTVPGSDLQSEDHDDETDMGPDVVIADVVNADGGASDIMDLDEVDNDDDPITSDEDDLDEDIDADDADFEDDEDDLIDLDLEDEFEDDDFDDLDDEDYDDHESDADESEDDDQSEEVTSLEDEEDEEDEEDDNDEADPLVTPIRVVRDDDSLDDRDEKEEGDLTLSELIAGAGSPEQADDVDDVEENANGDADFVDDGDADDDDESSSVISSAATSLGDRLTALLDTDETDQDDKVDPKNTLPTSLLQPVDAAEAESELVVEDAAEEEVRSTLVSFPKRELVMDDPVSVDENLSVESDVLDTSDLKVIDDLAADDVIRASREPENSIFDPDGDPVENAMRYLERQASENEAKKSGGGLWIPIALGALLIGASAVMLGRGATQMLSTWGPTAVTAAAITGGLTLIFGIYAAARSRFA